MENNYLLYIHLFPNNKLYIGITNHKDPNDRWDYGKGYRKDSIIRNAIEKYGWDNIKHYVVVSNLTQKEAYNAEKLLIKQLKTQDKRYGYNVADGGSGGNNKPMKKVKQYSKDGQFIKLWDSQADAARSIGVHRTNICNAIKRHILCKGFQWCYENESISQPYKRKLPIYKKRDIFKQKNPNAKKVVCLNTGEMFNCIKDASEKYNASIYGIGNTCHLRAYSSGRIHKEKLVWRFVDDYNKMTQSEIKQAIILANKHIYKEVA